MPENLIDLIEENSKDKRFNESEIYSRNDNGLRLTTLIENVTLGNTDYKVSIPSLGFIDDIISDLLSWNGTEGPSPLTEDDIKLLPEILIFKENVVEKAMLCVPGSCFSWRKS